MVNFTREKSEDGVTERLFDLTVAGERVPAAIWAPDNAKGPRPLVLMGHGGSQHKKIGTLVARARQYAQGSAMRSRRSMPLAMATASAAKRLQDWPKTLARASASAVR